MSVGRIAKSCLLLIMLAMNCSCVSFHRACITTCTDDDITTEILIKIKANRCLDYQYIDVRTHEHIVTLQGNVENSVQRMAAIDLAGSVSQVRNVISKLTIKNKYNI